MFGTKNSKTTGNVTKFVSWKTKEKEGDTRIHTSSYVTVAAFATKSNLKTAIRHIHLIGDKHAGEDGPS